jgi:hypothetical protein
LSIKIRERERDEGKEGVKDWEGVRGVERERVNTSVVTGSLLFPFYSF